MVRAKLKKKNPTKWIGTWKIRWRCGATLRNIHCALHHSLHHNRVYYCILVVHQWSYLCTRYHTQTILCNVQQINLRVLIQPYLIVYVLSLQAVRRGALPHGEDTTERLPSLGGNKWLEGVKNLIFNCYKQLLPNVEIWYMYIIYIHSLTLQHLHCIWGLQMLWLRKDGDLSPVWVLVPWNCLSFLISTLCILGQVQVIASHYSTTFSCVGQGTAHVHIQRRIDFIGPCETPSGGRTGRSVTGIRDWWHEFRCHLAIILDKTIITTMFGGKRVYSFHKTLWSQNKKQECI